MQTFMDISYLISNFHANSVLHNMFVLIWISFQCLLIGELHNFFLTTTTSWLTNTAFQRISDTYAITLQQTTGEISSPNEPSQELPHIFTSKSRQKKIKPKDNLLNTFNFMTNQLHVSYLLVSLWTAKNFIVSTWAPA